MNASAQPAVKRSPLRRLAVAVGFVAFVLALVFGGFLVFAGMANRHAEVVAVSKHIVDVPLPDFEAPLLLEPARRIGNADLRGAPFLVSTWASWCYGCAHEHPVLLRLAESGRVRMIGLNMKDDAIEAQRWLQQHGNPFSMVLFDGYGIIADLFGVMATPHHMLVDADGIVRGRWRGTMSDERMQQELLPLLDRLQARQPPSQTTPAPAAQAQAVPSPEPRG
jgi:cytochrome c biogenesis protein CcmG/thiol:disulfide interchange protein DsbE